MQLHHGHTLKSFSLIEISLAARCEWVRNKNRSHSNGEMAANNTERKGIQRRKNDKD